MTVLIRPVSILLITVCFACTSCSMHSGRSVGGKGTGVLLEEVQGAPTDLRPIAIEVNRAAYKKAVAQPSSLQQIRIVRIYSHDPTIARTVPAYRIFDIAPGGVYDQLGLRVGDTLLAVDGWVLFDADKFAAFASLLEYSNEASLEVRRGEEAVKLQISLLPKLADTTIPTAKLRSFER